MQGYIGIDTSNYTTSCAIYRKGIILQQKRLLPVPQGQMGLRQSDAVFSHVKALAELMTALRQEDSLPLSAIGASIRPRDVEGSYMPCFLVGKMAAESIASVENFPCHHFSHQAGHVAAALYGANRLDLLHRPFLAFHLSGGTTECLWVRDLLAADIVLLHHTNDLNAGQIVDRVGGMLGLPFPAGPALDLLAQQSSRQHRVKVAFVDGNPCLSGIENQCRTRLAQGEAPCDIAKYALDAIQSALLQMTEAAIAETGCQELVFAGGVMSNTLIRKAVEDACGGIFSPREYSCDNAAGIALLTALCAGESVFRAEEV